MKSNLYCLLCAVGYISSIVIAKPNFTPQCCSECLTPTSGDYDPSDYHYIDTHPKDNGEKLPWCENCGKIASEPSFTDGIKVVDNALTMQAGTWIKFTWSNAAKVTYHSYLTSQTRQDPVKYSSSPATPLNDGTVFALCIGKPGKVYMRAFSTDGCLGSKETILNIAGDEKECTAAPSGQNTNPSQGGGSKGNAGTGSKGTGSTQEVPCNKERGFIDSDNKCHCTNDYAGPPNCSDFPVWKWVVTICGGLAALVSIAVSVHAYMQRRKRRARLSTDSGLKVGEDLEVLRVTPESRSIGADYELKSSTKALPTGKKIEGSPRECTL